MTIHWLGPGTDGLIVTTSKILLRISLAMTFAALLVFAGGSAFAQVPSLDDLSNVTNLTSAPNLTDVPTLPLPSASPSPVVTSTPTVDEILGGSGGPVNPIGGQLPDSGDVVDTVTGLLNGGGTDPGPTGGGNNGGGTGGTGSGGSGGGTIGGTTGPTSGIGSRLAPATNATRGMVDPRAVTGSARLNAAMGAQQLTLGVVKDRALHLAAPMAAPIGIAIAGVLGLVMLAKSSGKLDGLENERKALGGWTVINL